MNKKLQKIISIHHFIREDLLIFLCNYCEDLNIYCSVTLIFIASIVRTMLCAMNLARIVATAVFNSPHFRIATDQVRVSDRGRDENLKRLGLENTMGGRKRTTSDF